MKMVFSCFCFAVAGACVYQSRVLQGDLLPIVASAVRILVNIVIVLGLALYRRDFRTLWGDGRASLWWRGIFGTAALILSFSAIAAIGIGESSFLQASSSLFVGLLGPLVLGVRNPPRIWVALLIGMVGVGLLFHPRVTDLHPLGRVYGIGSGLFSALAYLMISRAGRSNRPQTMIFYFCLVGALVHGALFMLVPFTWPRELATWLVLLAAGLAASVGQHYLTRSYQEAPAAQNAVISYVGPLMSTGLGIVLFANRLDVSSWIGAALIISCGVFLPWAKLASKAKSRSGLELRPDI